MGLAFSLLPVIRWRMSAYVDVDGCISSSSNSEGEAKGAVDATRVFQQERIRPRANNWESAEVEEADGAVIEERAIRGNDLETNGSSTT